jgi:hypothetical protein
MLGSALLIAYFGIGPLSLDARRSRHAIPAGAVAANPISQHAGD